MPQPDKSESQRGKVLSTKGYLLECENCGDLGFATRGHARYCSKLCKDTAGKRRRRAFATASSRNEVHS